MSKPFHVYLDLDVFNNSTDFTSKAPQLSFEETRTQTFLDGTADDYFVAIARFSIQTGSTLPVLIPTIDTTQSDPNKTVYRITLMYKGVVGSATVIYSPQNSHDAVAPPNGVNGQDFSGNYYYIYNYQDWITMINTALINAHTDLKRNVRATSALARDGFPGQPKYYREVIQLFTWRDVGLPYTDNPHVFTNAEGITTSILKTPTDMIGGLQFYNVTITLQLIIGVMSPPLRTS